MWAIQRRSQTSRFLRRKRGTEMFEQSLQNKFDMNGVVNTTDLNDLAVGWQRTDATSWADGGFDANGIVNVADLDFIGLNWLHGTGPAAAVPEPIGLGIWLLALMVVRLRRQPS